MRVGSIFETCFHCLVVETCSSLELYIKTLRYLQFSCYHSFQNALEAYVELDEKIFEAYCEQKTEPLVGALEPGMYIGHFEWHNCPIPTGKWNSRYLMPRYFCGRNKTFHG